MRVYVCFSIFAAKATASVVSDYWQLVPALTATLSRGPTACNWTTICQAVICSVRPNDSAALNTMSAFVPLSDVVLEMHRSG